MNKWTAFSPLPFLLTSDFNRSQPLAITEELQFKLTPSDFFKDETFDELLGDKEKGLLKSEQHSLIINYEAEAIGRPIVSFLGETEKSIQEAVTEKIALFPLSLWIIAPSAMTLKPIGHVSINQESQTLRHYVNYDPMVIHESETTKIFTAIEWNEAISFYKKLIAINSEGTMLTVVKLLHKAVREREWAIRFLLHTMILEAIFGPEDGREITYRLSIRVAHFISIDKEEKIKIFNDCKNLYKRRSQIVHGMRVRKFKGKENPESLVIDIEKIVRRSLIQFVSDDCFEELNSKKREDFLDSYLFS